NDRSAFSTAIRALCTSVPLPSSTLATLVSACELSSPISLMAPRKVSAKPPPAFPGARLACSSPLSISEGSIRNDETGLLIGLHLFLQSAQTSGNSEERLAQNLQRLLNHALRRLHRRRIELISPHRAQQVRHLHHRIYIGISHKPRAVRIGMPRLITPRHGRCIIDDPLHSHTAIGSLMQMRQRQ